MQSVCSVIPAEFNRQVIDARAEVSRDPRLGAIYDPPFAHFTHQLAEDYDWEGLEQALSAFATTHQPLEVRTAGLLCFTGDDTAIAVAVYRSPELVAYHDELWRTVLPFAKGRTRRLDEPATWLPHITVKRCGTHREAFGRAMAGLSTRSFVWTMTIDNVSVQHDPGQNSLTHYQRLSFPLGGGVKQRPALETNATLITIEETNFADGVTRWKLRLKADDGADIETVLDAPAMTRIMAACDTSWVHFAGGRCRFEDNKVTAVVPNTPFPVM